MKRRSITYTTEAKDDLRQIFDYLSNAATPRVAHDYVLTTTSPKVSGPTKPA